MGKKKKKNISEHVAQLVIGNETIDVLLTPNLEREEYGPLFGLCDYNNARIELDPNVSAERLNNVFWHEVIHMISDVYAIELEEHQVRLLEVGLLAFVRDNPRPQFLSKEEVGGMFKND